MSKDVYGVLSVYGYLWVSMGLYRCLLVSIGVFRFIRVYGYLQVAWVFMGVYGGLWISGCL